jgi:murein DD-endopeptidase MepM/ murein hydrolase activator NlpD
MTIVSKSLVLQGQIGRSLSGLVSGLFPYIAILWLFMVPFTASASIFPFFAKTAQANFSGAIASAVSRESIIQSSIGPATLSDSLTYADSVRITESALSASVGPMGGTINMLNLSQNGGQISVYTVRHGDTLADIAKMFGVTRATIISANSLSRTGVVRVGQELVIFPTSGYVYTARRGDTLSVIADRVGVPAVDIAFYNDLDTSVVLRAGDTILIPDAEYGGEVIVSASAVATTGDSRNVLVRFIEDTLSISISPMKDSSKRNLGKALLRPIALQDGYISQGAHGWGGTAVDIAAPSGTPVRAAASGKILVARSTGYNDGYGRYIILRSEIQGVTVETIYAHLSRLSVTVGQTVERGQVIGYVGSTGDSTGNHLHFEVRGALNPLVGNSKYTGE